MKWKITLLRQRISKRRSDRIRQKFIIKFCDFTIDNCKPKDKIYPFEDISYFELGYERLKIKGSDKNIIGFNHSEKIRAEIENNPSLELNVRKFKTFRESVVIFMMKYDYLISIDQNTFECTDIIKDVRIAGGHKHYQKSIKGEIDRKKLGFWGRKAFIEKFVIAVITGGISLMVGLTISKQSKESQRLIDKQQDSLIKDVSDTLTSIQLRLDTLK